ncbi:hypothetical protein [Paenibacillus medicaginis]|uniref:Uncharacterized protein n=1 Tax=Paenibacillus medicaginis TaxID=1470560 RepID=A0ABV5C3A7_9BACL
MRQIQSMKFKKQKLLGLLLISIGTLILIKTISGWLEVTPALFYIGGYGEVVGKFPVRDEVVNYQVTFDNPTKRTFIITSVQPILTDQSRDLLIGKIKPIKQVKRLKTDDVVEYSGEFHLNTMDLTEEEIQNMIPIVEGYKVVFNSNEEIILPVKIN